MIVPVAHMLIQHNQETVKKESNGAAMQEDAQQTNQLQPTPYEHVVVGGMVAVVSSACMKLEALVTWPLYCIQ